MEYGESTTNGGVTYQHQCSHCGGNKHHVKGCIRYAYVFLQSLPLYPVGRRIELECTECLTRVDQQGIDAQLYKQLLGSAFTIYQFLIKFTGLILLIYLAASWWQERQAEQRQLEQLVSYPQINDFLLIDYRKLNNHYRPHEKFRIAKVVDLTGDTVSVIYGNFFYQHQSSFEEAISSGQTRAFSYFGKNSHNFTQAQFTDLYQREGIVKAARPEGNMLFGNFIISDTGYQVSTSYIPGEREYASGLAFERASYIEDHLVKAFMKFEQSATQGFAAGQIKLAEIYLAGDVVKSDFDTALYWLEQASLQSNKRAIKKFAIVCQQTKACDLASFYQRLLDFGVNITVNKKNL